MALELADIELNRGKFAVRALNAVLLAAGARLLAVTLDLFGSAAQARGVDLEAFEVIGNSGNGGQGSRVELGDLACCGGQGLWRGGHV